MKPALDTRARRGVALSELTTIRLGGEARRLVDATTTDEILATLGNVEERDEPLLIMGGGSNLVIADSGFPGTVLRVLTRGMTTAVDGPAARLTVAAGEPWENVVARSVADGLAGLECLAGIPGSAGATPIQNVGAYGQQVSDVIRSVRAYDRQARAVVELTPAQCAFGYRTSRFRGSDRHVVLDVTFGLERSSRARPLRHGELARRLQAGSAARPSLAEVAEAVVALRRSKGMVIDPADDDTVSAGSFFVNPVLAPEAFAALRRRVADSLGGGVQPPEWPAGDAVKTSAAWLIERAGFQRGYRRGAVAISAKHTLALVNRGGASSAELLALAREVREGVRRTFGVTLEPEPTFVGLAL